MHELALGLMMQSELGDGKPAHAATLDLKNAQSRSILGFPVYSLITPTRVKTGMLIGKL